MIYLWNIQGDTLELNIREILKYPELAKLYGRDKSNLHAQAKREFHYIDFLCNIDSFPIQEGLTKEEAHAFAVKHSNLLEDYKPDKDVKKAINLVKELNGGVIENMLIAAISALKADSVILNKTKVLLEKLTNEADDVESFDNIFKLTNTLLTVSSQIPAKVKSLTELKENYDKVKKNGGETMRGGGDLKNSYEGRGFEELSGTGEVERLD